MNQNTVAKRLAGEMAMAADALFFMRGAMKSGTAEQRARHAARMVAARSELRAAKEALAAFA